MRSYISLSYLFIEYKVISGDSLRINTATSMDTQEVTAPDKEIVPDATPSTTTTCCFYTSSFFQQTEETPVYHGLSLFILLHNDED